eukprot:Blabericola_migrator_1__1236@NODE_1317_length_4827_cov_19_255252_g887_i0_p4_GENE_NODE_1317_length_4827_cov_19_255252_g887_i0NODE_1317_length_4827_cov_19_255252_g887_i0_p4_ORF_typecomplete_len228_score7_58DUF4870/PF09685_10/14DUF4870/PF09685_10/0_15DUF5345/PF17280_2/50DUF5345/PF17280_2/0_29DUF3717/PF12512_8/0_26DUF4181/PF13789_6/37DUF4181/PF13789_6/3_3TauE/PF01925_19/3_4e02TauE/PF01925_19/4_NODE_1317_length_4827_cov_19_255252_g887_i013282011
MYTPRAAGHMCAPATIYRSPSSPPTTDSRRVGGMSCPTPTHHASFDAYSCCEDGRSLSQLYGRAIVRYVLEISEWFGFEPPIPSCQVDFYEIHVRWSHVLLLWIVSVPLMFVLMLHVYPLLQLVPAALGFCLIIRSYDAWNERHDIAYNADGGDAKKRRFSLGSKSRHSKGKHMNWNPLWLYISVAAICVMLTILWKFYFPVTCLLISLALLLPIIVASSIYRPITQ